MSEIETDIESHRIGGHGSLLDFIKQSQQLGVYDFSDRDLIGYLKKAATLEEKEARDLVAEMIKNMEYMAKNSDELRKRFATAHMALDKINNTIKSRAEAGTS